MFAERFEVEMSSETARELKDAVHLAVRELEVSKQFPPSDLNTKQRRARAARIDEINDRLDRFEDQMMEALEELGPEPLSERARRWPSVV